MKVAPGQVHIAALQSQLKNNKAQVQSLEIQIELMTATRNETTDQLVTLEHEIEHLRNEASSTALMKEEMLRLEEQNGTLLEMLGEKEEKILELGFDISDMKEAFRSTIMS